MGKILRKIILSSLTILFAITVFPGEVALTHAATIVESGTCGAEGNEENVIWEYDSEDVLTIKGTGEMRGYDYTLYDRPAWEKYADTVKKIVVSDGITSIGRKAFYKMSEAEVSLPDTLVSIGYEAFKENKNLTNIELPSSLENMGSDIFWNCPLTKIVVPGSLDMGPIYMFGGVAFDYIVIEEGVETIGYGVFGSSRFKRLWLPSTITMIRDDAFQECTDDEDWVCYGFNDYVQRYATAKKFIYVDASQKYSLSDDNVTLSLDSVIYDGTEKVGTPIVTYNHNGVEVPLYEGYDYSVSYKDNKNIGTATVTISGKGCYTGSVEKTYQIVGDLTESSVILEADSLLYDGTDKNPGVTIKWGDKMLTENIDYVVSYANNREEGCATVTITGQGNYVGTITRDFTIMKIDIADADATLEYGKIQYDGTSKKPGVEIKYKGVSLVEGKDYTVAYMDNLNAGVAKVVVTGMGQYKGQIAETFNIQGISLEGADIKLSESIFSYDGSEKKTLVTVVVDGVVLTVGKEYTVAYKDNINEGTAYAIITGRGNYSGTISLSFTILPYNAGMDSVYDKGDTLLSDEAVYMITDDEEKEVEYSSISNKKVTKVEVPATIIADDGTKYKVTSIGNKAFYKNTKIKSVTIGNNVKSIEDYAFYGCKNLTTIKMGKHVEMIGNSSFRKCTKLKCITLPKSLDVLGKNAFYGCSKLKSITINANTVVDISANAIKGVSQKCVIKVPQKLTNKYKKEFTKKTGYKSSMKIKKK